MKTIATFIFLALLSCNQPLIETEPNQENLVVPADISPEHKFGSTNFTQAQTRNCATIVRNFGGDVSGPVSFYVQKMQPVIELSFSQSDTSYVIGIDTVSLNNSLFTMIEQAVRYKFTVNSIPPGGALTVGYKLTSFSGNGGATWQSFIVPGSGGDITPGNNLIITYLYVQ